MVAVVLAALTFLKYILFSSLVGSRMEGKAISFDISIVFDSTTVNQEKKSEECCIL